jgi:hypothetical protein
MSTEIHVFISCSSSWWQSFISLAKWSVNFLPCFCILGCCVGLFIRDALKISVSLLCEMSSECSLQCKWLCISGGSSLQWPYIAGTTVFINRVHAGGIISVHFQIDIITRSFLAREIEGKCHNMQNTCNVRVIHVFRILENNKL